VIYFSKFSYWYILQQAKFAIMIVNIKDPYQKPNKSLHYLVKCDWL